MTTLQGIIAVSGFALVFLLVAEFNYERLRRKRQREIDQHVSEILSRRVEHLDDWRFPR